MLFSVKNRLASSLAVLAVFVVTALAARRALDLSWDLSFSATVVRNAALGLTIFLLGDGVLHALFGRLFGERYDERYRALVDYFRPQRSLDILAGGVLAGAGEELFFRGVLLEVLRHRTGLSAAAAISLSATAFGALHTIPDARLRPFALWAVWQGVLLGTIYVLTGSLLVPMLVHFCHDTLGFSLFAYQRRTRWRL